MDEHEHICGECLHHQKLIDDLAGQMPDTDILADVAELLGLFGDKTRVLCVSDIAQRLGMTASAISHQLRILKQGRLVRSRREGKTVFYSLADSHVKTIFYHALEHVTE